MSTVATSEYRPHLLCRILGCKCGDDYGACVRCGLDHEYGYVLPIESYAWPILNIIHRIRDMIWAARNPGHCEVCHKPIRWLRRSREPYTCSQECYDEWFPF